MDLLKTAGDLWYDTNGTITEAQLRKAVASIRRMVTVQREKQKKYGNTFDFDVDAALADPKPPKASNTFDVYVILGGEQTRAENPGLKPNLYSFNTLEEANAFRQGLMEAEGWETITETDTLGKAL